MLWEVIKDSHDKSTATVAKAGMALSFSLFKPLLSKANKIFCSALTFAFVMED